MNTTDETSPNTPESTWTELTDYLARSRAAKTATGRDAWYRAAVATNARRRKLGFDVYDGRPD